MQKPVLGSAVLVPGLSVARFVLQQLLAGIKVCVEVDGQPREGLVCNLDLAPGESGSDHLFAKVHVPDSEGEGLYVRVAIQADGKVSVLPNQDPQ